MRRGTGGVSIPKRFWVIELLCCLSDELSGGIWNSLGSAKIFIVNSCSSYIFSFLFVQTNIVDVGSHVNLLCTYCSIHKGFSVVFKSSIICFLIKASFRLVSVGIEITQFFKQQQRTIKLMAPTKSTIRSAIIAAKAISNSSCMLVVYAGMTFSIAKP